MTANEWQIWNNAEKDIEVVSASVNAIICDLAACEKERDRHQSNERLQCERAIRAEALLRAAREYVDYCATADDEYPRWASKARALLARISEVIHG